jgi:hypothetical protein
MNIHVALRERATLTAFILVAGLLFSVFVVGPNVVNPFNTSWLTEDASTHHLCWRFLRGQSLLTFPLGWSHLLGFPLGQPIAHFDCGFFYATLLWPFRNFLPEDLQYIGVLFVLHSVLQLYFGYKISLYLSGGDRLVGVLGGLLFMTAPSFVWRAHGHFALSGQWLILAALYEYLRSSIDTSRRTVVAVSAISFVAAGINPYLTVMVLMVAGAISVKYLSLGKSGFTAACAVLIIPALFTGFSLLLFGYLQLDGQTGYTSDGYRFYSMNLFAPFDPFDYRSILLSKIEAPYGQYEGYNYLGLGVILLFVVSLLYAPSILSYIFRKQAVGLWMLVAASIVLALSAKAVAGTTVIYDLKLPPSVEAALNTFRASGRLFWPAAYVLLAASIGGAVYAFKSWAPVVISAALFIQFMDLNGLYESIRNKYRVARPAPFTKDPEWQAIGKSHRHLIVLPAWQCNSHDSPGGVMGFFPFGLLAAKYGMTINSYYVGRYSKTQLDFFCRTQPQTIFTEGLKNQTAYVFSDASKLRGLDLKRHFCRYITGFPVCSQETGKSGLDSSIVEAIAKTEKSVSLEGARSASFDGPKIPPQWFALGWSFAESWGRWTDGQSAVLALTVDGSVREIRLTVFPYGPMQRVSISMQDEMIRTLTLTEKAVVSIPINPTGDANNFLRIRLELPDAISPAELEQSKDTRKLGLGLMQIEILAK